jgi:hypothetical protein
LLIQNLDNRGTVSPSVFVTARLRVISTVGRGEIYIMRDRRKSRITHHASRSRIDHKKITLCLKNFSQKL